jgi:hypothetical protein
MITLLSCYSMTDLLKFVEGMVQEEEAKASSRPTACMVIGHQFVCSISVASGVILVSINDVSTIA